MCNPAQMAQAKYRLRACWHFENLSWRTRAAYQLCKWQYTTVGSEHLVYFHMVKPYKSYAKKFGNNAVVGIGIFCLFWQIHQRSYFCNCTIVETFCLPIQIPTYLLGTYYWILYLKCTFNNLLDFSHNRII